MRSPYWTTTIFLILSALLGQEAAEAVADNDTFDLMLSSVGCALTLGTAFEYWPSSNDDYTAVDNSPNIGWITGIAGAVVVLNILVNSFASALSPI